MVCTWFPVLVIKTKNVKYISCNFVFSLLFLLVIQDQLLKSPSLCLCFIVARIIISVIKISLFSFSVNFIGTPAENDNSDSVPCLGICSSYINCFYGSDEFGETFFIKGSCAPPLHCCSYVPFQ